MDFKLSQNEQDFQKQVHEFLRKEVTPDLVKEMSSGLGLGPLGWQFTRKLGAKRWLVPMLPPEYGGLSASFIQRFIVMDEINYFLPGSFAHMGSSIVAPTLMLVGSEEQKKEYIPKIGQGEIEFALGYTEPQAGSDLSAIDIRAVEQDDHFLMNGQKVFNSGCHYSQYHWLCARTEVTEVKHKGLSLFIVPMDTPGITIRPLWAIGGERTNEVFYDNVKVPKKNLVGTKNKGFYHMMVALEFERIFPVGHLFRALEDLVTYVKETKRGGKPLAEDPLIRQKIADLAILAEVGKGLAYHIAWMLDQGQAPDHHAAALKVFLTETEQQMAYTGLRIMGAYGQLGPNSKHAPLDGWLADWFLLTIRRTITGGTNEIQRNVIAQRGLGLPRG